MTLDRAMDRFEERPTMQRASRLMLVALDYRNDGMISDATFFSIIRKIPNRASAPVTPPTG